MRERWSLQESAGVYSRERGCVFESVREPATERSVFEGARGCARERGNVWGVVGKL